MEYPALVTIVALFEYMFFAYRVGSGRIKHNVPAPATSGHEVWDRMYRAQVNTLEQLIVFIPALWLFAWFVHPLYAAVIGLLFVIGRPLYFFAYVRDPGSRTAGFMMGFLSVAVLLIGGLVGVLGKLLAM